MQQGLTKPKSVRVCWQSLPFLPTPLLPPALMWGTPELHLSSGDSETRPLSNGSACQHLPSNLCASTPQGHSLVLQ